MYNYRIFSSGGCGTKYLKDYLKNVVHIDIRSDKNPHLLNPPKCFRARTKIIYIYANPIDMVLSFFNRNEFLRYREGYDGIYYWAYKHCKNLQGNYRQLGKECNLKKYLGLKKDVFLLERHFDNWTRAKLNCSIAYIKYETLSDHVGKLLKFVDADVLLRNKFAWKRRKSNSSCLSKNEYSGLENRFRSLIKKMDAFPPILIR